MKTPVVKSQQPPSVSTPRGITRRMVRTYGGGRGRRRISRIGFGKKVVEGLVRRTCFCRSETSAALDRGRDLWRHRQKVPPPLHALQRTRHLVAHRLATLGR